MTDDAGREWHEFEPVFSRDEVGATHCWCGQPRSAHEEQPEPVALSGSEVAALALAALPRPRRAGEIAKALSEREALIASLRACLNLCDKHKNESKTPSTSCLFCAFDYYQLEAQRERETSYHGALVRAEQERDVLRASHAELLASCETLMGPDWQRYYECEHGVPMGQECPEKVCSLHIVRAAIARAKALQP